VWSQPAVIAATLLRFECVAVPGELTRRIYPDKLSGAPLSDARGNVEDDAVKPKARYNVPVACRKARKGLRPPERVALDELISRFSRMADDREVAITVRQLGEASGMTRMAASRALQVLENKGFIVVVKKGSYDAKRKPSLYRLTMFPCRGKAPTDDYIEDPKAWRRQRHPKAFTAVPKSVKLSFNVPVSQLTEFMDRNERFITAGPTVPSKRRS
jgi:predicted RNA binding protein YcfA (HicA-like mRNA interferase family)